MKNTTFKDQVLHGVSSDRLILAIRECDSFIEKEERRSSDLRPASIQNHLDYCKNHKAKLQKILNERV